MNFSFFHPARSNAGAVLCLLLCAGLVLGLAASCRARGPLSLAVPVPVDHPVTLPADLRTASAWRQGVGAWGENFVSSTLQARGYRVVSLKSAGGQGVDCIALKYDPAGRITDLKICEVKTGANPGRLGETANGRQLGRDWLAEKFRNARASSDPGARQLEDDIRRFCRERGARPEELAEVHEINVRTGSYRVRNALTGAEQSDQSVLRLLTRLGRRAGSVEARQWAAGSARAFGEVQTARMTAWLGDRAAVALEQTALRRGVAEAVAEGGGRAFAKVAGRLAGPIGLAAAFGYDAWQIYAAVSDYHAGRATQRETVITVSRIGGGMAGAAGGMYAGGTVGAFGGPLDPVTVPVGAAIGGIAGYFFGSGVGEKISTSIYNGIDERTQARMDTWMVHSSYEQALGPFVIPTRP